ncbi:MAG: hypothetical protein DRP42_02700 [Tenericutes bacterium]|nr:MAG: hypothetical protein DRP42_02700 [Mycoplasmatota bacterium]
MNMAIAKEGSMEKDPSVANAPLLRREHIDRPIMESVLQKSIVKAIPQDSRAAYTKVVNNAKEKIRYADKHQKEDL